MVRRKEKKNMDPFKYASGTAHQNPPLDPPESNPKEFCTESLKRNEVLSFRASAWNTHPSIQPTSSVCLGKLLFTHQNPTRLSPLPRNVPCPTAERGNHALHSGTSASSSKLSSIHSCGHPSKTGALFKRQELHNNE